MRRGDFEVLSRIAEGERVDLLAEHPEVAGRLRGLLEAHNEAQAEPL